MINYSRGSNMTTSENYFTDNNGPNPQQQSNSWEHDIVKDLAFAALKEQRNRRRWGYLFKSLIILNLVAIIILITPLGEFPARNIEHTALVEIQGVIDSNAEASADTIVAGIQNAFDNAHAHGLIISLNTPGGSPVQASIINNEIKQLKKTRPNFPVYAVIKDICASGGYYVAAATDEIYANKASIVGSIGVRMDSFGFTGTMDKLGVERRLLTAGRNKGSLDPFLPVQQEALDHINTILKKIHQEFIYVVKSGRGKRLSNDPKLFTGAIWSGEQALSLGLIDGFATSSHIARKIIGAKNIVDYTPRPDYIDQFAGKLGTSLNQIMLRSSFFNSTLR